MRISIDINGYYDWVPCPPGTEITKADVEALRVKQMSDDKWHMRVTMKSPDPAQTHDVGVHEESLARQIAVFEKLDKPIWREEVVYDFLKAALRPYLHHAHIVKINVVDDGPDEALFRRLLAEVGVTNEAEGAVGRYMEPCDMEASLNKAFKTGAFRRKREDHMVRTSEDPVWRSAKDEVSDEDPA